MYIPVYVKEIIDRLESFGYEAYLVGGAVRDSLIARKVQDYDIATNCHPNQLIEMFKDKKTILVGKEFGTVIIINKSEKVEVTTYRLDGKYRDGRKPESIDFSKNLSEDLKRRDFTINALAYNPREGYIDLFEGKKDLESKIIRTVGDPKKRFSEDYLRILRAVRFSAQLDFRIEENTFIAMKNLSQNLDKISYERVRDEFFKIMTSNNPSKGINLLKETGILKLLFRDIYNMIGFEQHNPNHKYDVYEHSLCVVENTDNILALRLAALFHDIGKVKTFTIDEEGVGHFYGHADESRKISKKILKKLNSPKKLIQDVDLLIRYHMNAHDQIKEKGLKRLIRTFGEKDIFNLIKLQLADVRCSNNRKEDIDFLLKRKSKIENIIDSKETYHKKQLKIDGRDLINLGFEQGKIIGEILDFLYDRVLEDNSLNDRDKLLDLVKDKYL